MEFPRTKIIFRIKNAEEIISELRNNQKNSIVILRSKTATSSCAYDNLIKLFFDVINCQIIGDYFVTSELSFEQIRILCGNIRRHSIERTILLAVGGGSVIDAAKAIKYFLWTKQIRKRNLKKEPIIVAVPTTAGSGSEVTRFAVWKTNKNYRVVVEDRSLVPQIAIIDGIFQQSIPSFLKSYAAADALSHALDTLLNKYVNRLVYSLSEFSLHSIMENIKDHCKGFNYEVAQTMVEMATISGICNHLVGCSIIHAFAYAISEQISISHGAAILFCLPAIIEYILSKGKVVLPKGILRKTTTILLNLPVKQEDVDKLQCLNINLAVSGIINNTRLMNRFPEELTSLGIKNILKEVLRLWKN
ncbi:MAG: iron-containing alcohol dehydrogenase [Fervidobacterium sp.]